MTDGPDQDRALVLAHTGRTTLPRPVRAAVRRLIRRAGDDPELWLIAARGLARTARPAQAYRCYRRAARLRPDDPALAEEVGLFGARRLRQQYSRSWPVYLTRARRDPVRRERVDRVLVPMARRLPAELSLWATVSSVFATMLGAYTVRRFYPLQLTPPPDVEPFPPAVGALAAVGVLLILGGLVWLLFRPVRRFGGDVLRQGLRRPRIIHVLAVLGATVSVVGSVVVAAYGATPMFDAYARWLLPVWGVSLILSLAGLPFREVLAAAVQVAAGAARK
jgi:hypothetical protein